MDAGVPRDENRRERAVSSKDASPGKSRSEDGVPPRLRDVTGIRTVWRNTIMAAILPVSCEHSRHLWREWA